jgi:hypothetical protein
MKDGILFEEMIFAAVATDFKLRTESIRGSEWRR